MKKIQQVPKALGKYYTPLILFLMSLIMFSLMFGSVRQKQVTYKVGQLSSETIRANKTIENKDETKEKQKLAMESVTPEYTYNPDVETKQIEYVKTIFDLVNQVNETAEKQYNEKKSSSKPTVEDKLPMLKSNFEKYSQNDIAFFQSFPDTFYEQLLELPRSDLTKLEETSENTLRTILAKHIRNSTLQGEKQTAKEMVQYDEFSSQEINLLVMIFDKAIVVNEVVNDKATESMKESAKNNVLPVMIYQGEIIVREGEQIDSKAMEKIKLLGLTNQSTSTSPLLSMLLVILLQVVLIGYILRHTNQEVRVKSVTLYAVAITVSVLFMKLLYLFQKDNLSNVSLLFPAAFGSVILYMFLDKRWGLLMGMFQAIFSII